MAATGTTAPGTGAPGTGPIDCNLGVLVGELSSDPRSLQLDSGSMLLRLEVTVRDGAATDTVPVVRFDPIASELALAAGERVAVVGRVRRRFFRAGGTTASQTEVLAERVVPVASRRRVARLLGSAASRLEAAIG